MDNPGFYAILPASVRYNNRLKAAEKILFCEITALSDQNGYCHAQNGYFSQLYQVDERTIRRWIHQLEQLGYIRIEYEKYGDTQQRRIIPGGMPVQDGHTVSTPDKNVRPPRTEMSGPPGQNTSITIQDITIYAGARKMRKLPRMYLQSMLMDTQPS